MNTIEKKSKALSPWIYLSITVFAYVLCGINMYRLQPMLTTVMETLRIDEGTVGILVSSSTFLNIFITIPCGMLIAKIGIRKAGLLSICLLGCGSLVGSLFTGFVPILVAQSIASMGGAVISVTGPVFINTMFDEKRYSTAMSIFTVAQTIGQFLAFNLMPHITYTNHITPAWWLTTVLSLTAFLLWIVFIRKPVINQFMSQKGLQQDQQISEGLQEAQEGFQQNSKNSHHFISTLKNFKIWQMTIGGFFMMISAACVLSYLASYLVTERGMDLTFASTLCSFNALTGFVAAVAAGYLSDRFGSRKKIFLIAMLIMTALRVLQVIMPDGILLYIVVILQGLPAAGAAMLFATTPTLVKHPEEKSVAMAMVTTGTMAGTAVSSFFFGLLIRWFGYTSSFLILVPLSLLSLIGMMTVREVE